MVDPGEGERFQSRRQQSARARVAFQQIAALETDFVLHLGDLVTSFPDRPDFKEAMREALTQMESSGIQLRKIPGNHDLGDKPDPTMPTSPVNSEVLAWYHQEVGPSWFSFDHADCHFVGLNSAIMNTGLPEAEEQRRWLEQDLAENGDKRTFLFLHLPPYLWSEKEAYRGNYDNLGEPERGWLLELIRRYGVEVLFAAHVHLGVFDRYHQTRYFVARSTAFTRFGFSYLYKADPMPEQGRNDTPKMGFFLVRIRPEGTDVHLVRTQGAIETPAPGGPSTLITCLPSGLPHSRVGITLKEALTPVAEVPLAYPSSIRYPLRNDYPWLSCLELGIRSIRTQWDDLEDDLQRRRLDLLRLEGVSISTTFLGSSGFDLAELMSRHGASSDRWEFQSPGSIWPSGECLAEIEGCRDPVALSTVVPGEWVEGKHFPRTRSGYLPGEVEEMDRRLEETGLPVERLHCTLAGLDAWESILQVVGIGPLRALKGIDFSLPFSEDDLENANRAAEALLAASLLADSIVYFDPLIDLDRSKDIAHGLIDRVCNPRPAFHVVRCLNTLLFAGEPDYRKFQPSQSEQKGIRIRRLDGPDRTLSLLLPGKADVRVDGEVLAKALPEQKEEAEIGVYQLAEGGSSTLRRVTLNQQLAARGMTGPILLASPIG
jgi:hypothetical protein